MSNGGWMVVMLALCLGMGTCDVYLENRMQAREKHGCKTGHTEYSCGDGTKAIEKFKCDERFPEAP